MSTEIDDAVSIADGPEPPARPRPARRRRAWTAIVWATIAALAGFNAWWAWESRPLPELKSIDEWIRQGRYDEAGRALRDHLRRSPHHGEARIMLARVLAAKDDYLACAEQLHRVPPWWPKKAEALSREGQAYMVTGRARAAEEAWSACIADDPLHPAAAKAFTDAVHELVQLYKLEGRRDEAGAVLWRAYERTAPADHASILILRIWIELLKDEPAEAIDRLRRFVETTPDDWEARRALARAEQAEGRTAEADRHIRACLNARPEDPRVWRDWLAILLRRGDVQGLGEALRRLPKSADGDAEIWKDRGIVAERGGDPRRAADAYRRALRLRPFDADASYRLAGVERRLGARAEADEHLRRYKELNDAREALRKTYDRYLDVVQRGTPGEGEPGATIARLAELCRAIGLARDAEAWERLLPRS